MSAARGESYGMAHDDSFHTLIEATFPQRSVDVPGDDLIAATPPTAVTGRADCCPANAAVRVVLRATPARATHLELLLCAHHYRASRTNLAEAGASVFDSANRLISCKHGSPTAASLWPPV
jgi:hypothetical protein